MVKTVTRLLAILLSALAMVLTIAWQTSAHSDTNRLNVSKPSTPSVIATAPSPRTRDSQRRADPGFVHDAVWRYGSGAVLSGI